jgi:hypothetical protein
MDLGISYLSNKREVYEQSDPLVMEAGVKFTRYAFLHWNNAQPNPDELPDLQFVIQRKEREIGNNRRPVLTIGTTNEKHRPDWYPILSPGEQRQALKDMVEAVMPEVAHYAFAVQYGNEPGALVHNDDEIRRWTRDGFEVQKICRAHGVPFCTGGLTQWPVLIYALELGLIDSFLRNGEVITEPIWPAFYERGARDFEMIWKHLKPDFVDVHFYDRGNNELAEPMVKALRAAGAEGELISTEMGAPLKWYPDWEYTEANHAEKMQENVDALKDAGFILAMQFHEMQGSQRSENLKWIGNLMRAPDDTVVPIGMVQDIFKRENGVEDGPSPKKTSAKKKRSKKASPKEADAEAEAEEETEADTE